MRGSETPLQLHIDKHSYGYISKNVIYVFFVVQKFKKDTYKVPVPRSQVYSKNIVTEEHISKHRLNVQTLTL